MPGIFLDLVKMAAWSRSFLTVGYVTQPILLLLDGPSSHYSPDTIHSGAEEQVIIFADLSVCEDAIQTAIQKCYIH